jgi:membrane protease YdiL (CAAX protease family)
MTVSRKFALTESLGLAVALLLYSNGLTHYALRRSLHPETFFRRVNRTSLVLMLLYSALRPGGLRRVGLRREGLLGSVLGGVGVGVALSAPPLLFFFRPFLLDTPLEYGPIARMTREEMLKDVLFSVPVGIALTEELAHRGLLYSALEDLGGTKLAVLGSAAAFAGWHISVTAASAAESNLSDSMRLPDFLRPHLQPLAVLGGMLSTGFAGLLFGLLRARTGSLAGPVIAHWLVDAIMIAALWARRPQESGLRTE